MSAEPGILLVLSGPSGAGKSTALAKLMSGRDDVVFSVSATTRPPRPGETEGVHYRFLSPEQFSSLVETDALLEWAEYAGYRYGTPAAPVAAALREGKVVVLDIDVAGALQIMRKCPEAVPVFFTPSALAEVERRLRARKTETEEKIQYRMGVAREEYKYIDRYRYLVRNDSLTDAVRDIGAIINAERCRVTRRQECVKVLQEEAAGKLIIDN